jgi:hypothetical protein
MRLRSLATASLLVSCDLRVGRLRD